MKISRADVDYVARLARLELADGEKEKYTSQIESILEYISQLNTLDTKDIPPTSHIVPLSNVWREDKREDSTDETRRRILDNAPGREDDFFKVKKVIE